MRDRSPSCAPRPQRDVLHVCAITPGARGGESTLDPEREETGGSERAAVRQVVEADRQPEIEVLAGRVADTRAEEGSHALPDAAIGLAAREVLHLDAGAA